MIDDLNQTYSFFVTDINDFKNGVIFCDLIDLLFYSK